MRLAAQRSALSNVIWGLATVLTVDCNVSFERSKLTDGHHPTYTGLVLKEAAVEVQRSCGYLGHPGWFVGVHLLV